MSLPNMNGWKQEDIDKAMKALKERDHLSEHLKDFLDYWTKKGVSTFEVNVLGVGKIKTNEFSSVSNSSVIFYDAKNEGKCYNYPLMQILSVEKVSNTLEQESNKIESLQELSYQELYDQVRNLVAEKWWGWDKNDARIDHITNFIVHQGDFEVINNSVKEKIKDCHMENSEERMFNWIHIGGDESPFDIKNAPDVNEMGNVLVLEDGTCIFWYDIGVDKPPYSPYDKDNEEDYYDDMER